LVFELLQVGSSVVPILPNGRGSIPNLVGAERTLRDLVWQSSGSDGLPPSALAQDERPAGADLYRALKTLRERGFVRNVGTDSRLVMSAAMATLPILPTLPWQWAETLTANNPPLRGVGSDGWQ